MQAFIEARRIVPERCVPRLRQMNLRVRHRRLVLIDGGRFDNRICDAMCNQHRLADLRQEVVVAVMPPDVWTKNNLAVTRPGCLSMVKGIAFITPQFGDGADIGLAYEQLQLSPVVATSSARGKSSAA